MLTLQICFFALVVITKLKAEDDPRYYNFRSTFRTPKDTPKRNYDDFEILERASFHSEGSETPPKNDSPKATASAQIHVKIADKRSVKDGGDPAKPANDVDDTLKKLLIMLIKPLVENNNGAGRINPFFPFPPSPNSSPPHANLLGGLSALSTLSGASNNPEAVKKAAKIVHKLKEQLKAASVENEVEDVKKEDIPLKITLNNKPMKLQVDDEDENASVAEKSEKLVDLAKLLLKTDDEEEEKPKRRRKKPKVKAVDPLDVYMRRLFTQGCGCATENYPPYGGFNYNSNPLFRSPVRYDLNNLLALLTPKVVTTPQPQILATEFVVHVPVLFKRKAPSPPLPPPATATPLVNYPLLASLLSNYAM